MTTWHEELAEQLETEEGRRRHEEAKARIRAAMAEDDAARRAAWTKESKREIDALWRRHEAVERASRPRKHQTA